MNAMSKQSVSMFVVLFFAMYGCVAETSKLDATTERAFEIENKADCVVDYTVDGKYDIGVGVIDEGCRHSHLFDPNELECYFERLKHKDLIVVVIRKNTWDQETVAKHVDEINNFLFNCGFKRVVVQQGYGGSRGIWSDKTKHQPSAGVAGSTAAQP